MDTQAAVYQALSDVMDQCKEIAKPPLKEEEPDQHIEGAKRKIEVLNLFDKAKKRKRMHGPVQPKNATCQLNELHPGLKYEMKSQTGPIHNPEFEVSVTVNEQTFTGRGRSKKLAKQAAAEAALASFVQFVNSDDVHRILSKQKQASIDFTQDQDYSSFDERRNIFESDSGETIMRTCTRTGTGSPLNGDKNPVMLLNEIKSGLVYEVIGESGQPHAKIFTVKVDVEGETYEGQGSSKKLAKVAAAKAVLADLYNIKWKSIGKIDFGPNKFPQRLADQIAREVRAKFDELLQTYTSFNRRGVLAGVAMTRSSDPSVKVIAVTTGTKCINGEHISVSGTAVNDCHAEVLARRCLMDYIYSQLENMLNGKWTESIFEINHANKNFVLKDDIKFHLYISTAPCGDARVFSPHEGDDDDRHPNRKARGKLRTKIESGEGTIPVPDHFTQTWDGVLQGQRLLTMSCSDKIARWNVLGVQGSLLSLYVAPFYFESIVIGSLFHSQHMQRAIGGRLNDKIQGLPPPFVFHEPMLGVTTNTENRQTSKAPNTSVVWTLGMSEAELINNITGKLELGGTSRLTKLRFFERFVRLYNPMASQFDVKSFLPKRYVDAKAAAVDYQSAKSQLVDAFSRANLGVWVKKPIEQDQFEVDLSVIE